MTVGDPSLNVTRDVVLAAIDAGASVIELGVPFSDPLADGPVIQRASERALKNGATLADVLRLGGEVRKLRPRAGLIVFSYLNPILRYGLERFAQEASAAGIDGALVTDLTVEESAEYRSIMRRQDLAAVFLAAPTSPDARLKAVAEASTGFVYAVSRTGVTGAERSADIEGEVRKLVARIKKHTRLPVAVGFGISSPEQFHKVTAFADAAVVGSAIVRLIEENPGREADSVGRWVHSLLSKKH